MHCSHVPTDLLRLSQERNTQGYDLDFELKAMVVLHVID